MKKHILNSVALVFAVILFASCSVKKNSWATRTFHATTTRYNIYFNGVQSYEEGLKSIEKANLDDYSNIINMYPISSHESASSAKGNMDKAIEKSRKAIKVHSIKQKPKRNLKKANDPKYKAFYEQLEFNPALKDAWMLLGKAEFHKADFLGSVGTFSYIARHYSTDMDMVVQCQLWTARAYAEMGWIYEAEQVLSKINQDHVSRKNTALFAAVNADFLLKSKRYKEAIPYLELAASKEKDKTLTLRFNYLLAQLYQNSDNKTKAYDYYTKVIKKNPPYELDFNARMNRIQLNHSDIASVRKELNRMIRNSNNKDYLDQLYYAMGNSYLQQEDTAKAIYYYEVASDTSTRSGIEKAIVLVTLGDICYKQKKYAKAHESYEGAVGILPNTHDDYARVSRLSETLGELVFQQNIVVLQDSLLHLSTLSPEEQLAVVNKVIENLIAEEKAAEDRAAAKELASNDENPMMPIGGLGSSSDWYFYNQNLIRSGQAEFQRQWGRRKLEDNWRRASKSGAVFDDHSTTATNYDEEDGNISKSDSTKMAAVSDNKKPEYYLQQIPATEQQKELALEQVASALFEMGLIYKDKIEDFPMAEYTFNEFTRRFGRDKRVVDAYFQEYIMFTRNKEADKANTFRSKIISEFPESKYAQILYHDDYVERFERMHREQDSIYNITYKAYSANDFPTVFRNAEYIKTNYPLSTLMPKFMFLDALSVGKTDSPENFDIKLSELVEAYPQSDVSAMAKDIIALIRQGQESKTGTSHGSLLTRREEAVKTENEEVLGKQKFSSEQLTKHRLLFISSAPANEVNQLMYQIASYNFSRFMIKEFDLQLNQLDTLRTILSVTGFESYDEAVWYKNSISADATLHVLFEKMNAQMLIISEDNFALLRSGFTLDDYLAFISLEHRKEKAVDKPKPTTTKAEEKVKITTVELPPVSKEEKPADKKEEIDKTADKEDVKDKDVDQGKLTTAETVAPKIEPEEEKVPLYKNLYAYQPKQAHHVAIYVISGTVDFNTLKSDFDTYNAQNYAMLNLTIQSEKVNGKEVILIGSFNDADIAKSYFLRMIKEKSLFGGLKSANYRNMLGTQKNLNVMIQQNAMSVYFEFMREYYLK